MASMFSPRQRPSSKQSPPTASTSRSLNRKTSKHSFTSDNDLPYDDYHTSPIPRPPVDPRCLPSPPRQSNNDNDPHYVSSYRSTATAGEPFKPRKHQLKLSVKSMSSIRDEPRIQERKGKGREKELKLPDGSYDFSSILFDYSSYGNGQITPKPRSHFRPSASSTQYDWNDHPHIPSFRDSGSSSITQFETPPHTPIDDLLSLRGSMERISVVAPVSGVEVMDAMVDGMNGFGADDQFFSRSLSRRTSKTERAGFHPLYHPPLPKPPPGITLGGGITRRASQLSANDSDEDDEDPKPQPFPRSRDRRKAKKPSSSRPLSSKTVVTAPQSRPADVQFPLANPSIDEILQKPAPGPKNKQPIPSIDEIIQSHRTRKTSQSPRHISLDEEADIQPLTAEEAAAFLTRSSVDSVAEEVLNSSSVWTNSKPSQTTPKVHHARSFAQRQSVYSESIADISIRSPRSDGASIYSYSIISSEQPHTSFDFLNGFASKPLSASQSIAQYLRSARLTTILRLTCAPHASRDHPLTVSLSDLGCSTGQPLVVFLGLGCVRHVMGLYDEMAECLGLRLITIDRWGLGRTQAPRSKLARGIPEWSSVVAEVLDRLGIEKCSIMAHSAGAPYALAFANQYPGRIRGDICLLAPWIGEGAGYKWLKYVPNGILKTAQAADWKIQAWMLGKPPTIVYEGIGYNAPGPMRSFTAHSSSLQDPTTDAKPRRSIESSIFSEYDDLRDFDGRFESRSTVGKSMDDHRPRHVSESKNVLNGSSKKLSRGLLGKFRAPSNSQPTSPLPENSSPGPGSHRRLKALRSMGSLRSKSSSAPSTISRKRSSPTPQLPQPTSLEIGLGLDDIKWIESRTPSPVKRVQTRDNLPETPPSSSSQRANGTRSMSFGAHKPLPPSPPSPMPSSPATLVDVTGSSYQAMLGNALIAASHAESAKGTHSDLVQILNHDRVPWGFSYSDYPHTINVWYGDKDERIAESAVRWLQRTIGPDRCHVNVVKGADHALMYKSSVVVDVFEKVLNYGKDD